MAAARTELARLLGEVAPAEPPGVRLLADPVDLVLDVEGIGRVGLPLSAAQAKELCGLGRPARFGRGERTLTDRRVRDTWEVPKDLLRVQWSARFDQVLSKVRDGLGLPAHRPLVAELHSVLVYEAGQFFVRHQDSEKDDAMVATLVVTVPSAHAGGELVIHHGGQASTYRGSKTKLTLVAFYADTVHEVLPVSSGHRMALTYNLMLDGDPSAVAPWDDPAVAELASRLEAHLTTRPKHRYREQDVEAPNRLVYLLDHEYTARGLGWSRLKGSDARRAALLQAASDSLDCEVALALAEIQETWEALEPDTRYTRRRWSDEPDCSTGPDDYELQYLIDSSIRLTRWTDPAGSWAESISLGVDEDEVCASTPTVQLRPYEAEFEGYMGNYGNTMDRWYRRAAVIVWPRARSFEIRAEISPAQALDEVVARLKSAGRADREQARVEARAAVAELTPFWISLVGSQNQARYLPQALRAATALDDGQTATTLLSAFRVETLRPSHTKGLAALAARHGERWTVDLLSAWFGDPHRPRYSLAPGETRSQWLIRLPTLAEKLDPASGAGRAVGRHLLGLTWEQLRAEIDLWLATSTPSQQVTHLTPLGEPLAAILHAIAVLDVEDLRDQVLADIRNREQDAVPLVVIPTLRSATNLPAAIQTRAGCAALAHDCARRLTARLDRPARADGDWSLDLLAGCSCGLCSELGAFLRQADRTTLDWPLAEQRRRHDHDRLQRAELPVTHQTRRQGRPYTLVLTKQPTLFEQERQARNRDQHDLNWLNTTWGQRVGR